MRKAAAEMGFMPEGDPSARSARGGVRVTRRRFVGAAGLVTGLAALGGERSVDQTDATTASGRNETAGQRAAAFLGLFTRQPPFSFVYGGMASSSLLSRWTHTHTPIPIDANQMRHSITWSDPRGGLAVRCEAVGYHDFPTVEWTVYFKNADTRSSLPLQAVLALDTSMQSTPGARLIVHTCNGSAAVTQDYGPQEIDLAAGSFALFTCMGGRSTNGNFRPEAGLSRAGSPYYNVDWGGKGVVVVIGWPGQWAAEISRDTGSSLQLRAGMSTRDGGLLQSGDRVADAGLLDLSLLPGEEIRTPRIVVQFWDGPDWIASQNIWRRWMLVHNMPRPGGQLPSPMCPTQSTAYGPAMLGTSADSDIEILAADAADHLARARGGVVDHWWIDAGWYEVPPDATDWTWTGTWEPDPKRYPHGLKPVTDRARAQAMKSIVWTEPERVRPGTWLFTQHPEWLLGPGPDGDDRLLNLGHPQAWQWVVDHFDQFVSRQGVDVFRQDFNMDPLAYWNMGDPPGRTGITQARHVTGLLAFWDELRRRHPDLLIDCCASGGRRNDLETVRRAVPLWRSDDNGAALDEQCHTYGMALWHPYYGSGVAFGSGAEPDDLYTLRSGMLPSFMVLLEVTGGQDAAIGRALASMREWQVFAGDLLGDYYPLTPYSIGTDVWMAWQFNRPEAGTGVVQAFRRDTSTVETMRLKLRGLDTGARYELRNFDSSRRAYASGHGLMTAGLALRLASSPSAATVAYKRVTNL